VGVARSREGNVDKGVKNGWGFTVLNWAEKRFGV